MLTGGVSGGVPPCALPAHGRRETKFNIARIPISRIILECGMAAAAAAAAAAVEDSAKCGRNNR